MELKNDNGVLLISRRVRSSDENHLAKLSTILLITFFIAMFAVPLFTITAPNASASPDSDIYTVRFDVETLTSGGSLAATVLAPTSLIGMPIFVWGIIEVVMGVLAYPLEIGKGATSIYTTLASFTFMFAIFTTMLSQIPVITVGV